MAIFDIKKLTKIVVKNPEEVLKNIKNKLDELCIEDVQFWNDFAELEKLLLFFHRVIHKYPVSSYLTDTEKVKLIWANRQVNEVLHRQSERKAALDLDSVKGQAHDLLEAPSEALTSREKEVLWLIVQGFTMKEVAEKLKISHHTAGTHRKNLFKKLKINKTSELVHFALKNGLD